jgi:hypothetical protein
MGLLGWHWLIARPSHIPRHCQSCRSVGGHPSLVYCSIMVDAECLPVVHLSGTTTRTVSKSRRLTGAYRSSRGPCAAANLASGRR